MTLLLLASDVSISDPSGIISRAGSEAGWVAALLVFLVLMGFGGFGWAIRQTWVDLRSVRDFQQNTLVGLQEKSNEIMARSNDLLVEVMRVMEGCSLRQETMQRSRKDSP